MVAERVRPLDETTVLARRQWPEAAGGGQGSPTRLIAAATPMLAVLALVALPLAMTFESASSDVVRLTAPAVVTEMPSASVASALAVRIAMAAAAATVTVVPPFSPLFAFGVLDEPESLPLAAVDWALPLVSLFELSVEVSPESFFPGAPTSLELDSVSLIDAPSAAKLSAPPGLPTKLRFSCDETM